MSKVSVTAQKHLELLNEVLAEQPDFDSGMAFAASPPGSTGVGIWGYTTSTPYGSKQAYADAERIVREMYEFDPGAER